MRLEVQQLSFHYQEGRDILQDISFSCQGAEILCILGENGTGKSTLLKCITGEERGRGRVLLDGRDLAAYRPGELAKQIAYIPQTHVPIFPFRVLDVVMMGRTARIGYFASPSAQDEKLARENLDFLRIGHLWDKPYTDISGGERQLVLIAAALTQEPELLILDEPTAHLDFGNQHRFLNLVLRLRERGMGVLMTTHFPDHALYLEGRTLVLREGRLWREGSAREVVTQQTMSQLYRLSVHVETVGERVICIPGPLTAAEAAAQEGQGL